MKCRYCSGSMIFDQGHSLDPARLKCLSCGREERMPEEQKNEETRVKRKYTRHAEPKKKKLLPAVRHQETIPEKTTEMFKALRRAIVVDFLEEIRSRL